MDETFSDSLKSWLAQPYKGATSMSVLEWFLLVGLFLLICGSWRLILKHIEA